jgi:hypothetical protein
MDLAERCEAATRPDRELDAEIALATGAVKVINGWRYNSANRAREVEHFTASLDAAITLVPDGCDWLINTRGIFAQVWERKAVGDGSWEARTAATPALAMCAAALRALATDDPPEPR